MPYFLSPIGNDQQCSASGAPLSGGKIYTYLAGTSTPSPTYTDSTSGTTQANPIILNSLGLPASAIWMNGGISLKFVIRDAADVLIRTIDNVSGINDSAINASEWTDYTAVPTYISATSFSVPGDQTLTFQVNRRVRTSNTGGLVYGRITASVYASTITTVTVLNDSGALDSGLSVVSYGFLSFSPTSLPYAIYAGAGANNDITSLTALTAGGLPDNSVLTNDIANAQVTPAKLSQPFTAGTVVPTTSGTAIEFTGIPSWVKRVTVMLNGVSTSGTSNLIVQLGTAGSFETTGYDGGSWQANTTITAYSTGFMLGNSNAAASNVKETLVINLFDPATNTFVAFGTGAVNSAGGGNAHIQAGSKSLSGALTRLRITTVGGADTFDAGSMNISYE